MSQFVVTTRIGGLQKSLVWNAKAPLGLGHPFRWVLEKTATGFRVRELSTSLNQVQKAILHEVKMPTGPGEEHKEVTLRLSDQFQLDIRSASHETKSVRHLKVVHTDDGLDIENLKWFKSSLKYAVMAVASFVVMTAIWPKPKATDMVLIPEQFTKIVLSQPIKASAQSSGGAAAKAGNKEAQVAVKKVENAAIAQAFRAKALNSAVSSLLKGGMTSLLAQSDLVRGHQNVANAGRILDSKSKDLSNTALTVGDLNTPQVKVASLGGDGVSVGGGKGVGYKSGEHAGVEGQGKGHVKYSPMVSGDLLGSSVQEGLTKDEVGEVIHRHLSEIRYCYESAMIRSPDLEGKLIVDFVIGGVGSVKTTAVKTSTLPDPRLDDCILRRLVTWKFPNPKGGIDVAVSYPFIFKTLGR
ncbi:MAG: AgmX/PglI C-terminal domain-containing protein [Methylotenera sp.]|nr:AgmX/PglI C-terminal domain-containing protein [Oligoflexia bacterium]